MNWNDLLRRIPFLSPFGMDAAEDDEGATLVRLPFSDRVQNHVATLHAGALFTVAETAAGIAAWKVFEGGEAAVLLRSSNVRFTRRAALEVKARARAEPAAAEAARKAFEATRRADLVISAVVTDPDGETVFEGTFDYAVRAREALKG